MKTTHLAGVLAAVALGGTVIAGDVAVAQQPGQDRAARGMRADTDSDGRLSRAEFVTARVQRLTAADADGNGTVAAEEARTARQTARTARTEGRFERLDTNSDDMISRAEFDAPRADRANAGPRAKARGDRMAARAARMEARGPIVVADAQVRAEQRFTRMDANSDGFITADERGGVRENRLERMSERRAARQLRRASPSTPASE